MRRPASISPILLSIALGSPAFAQELADPAASLIRLADSSGNGEVEAVEWAAFVDGFAADEDGVLDPRPVLARLAFTDQDADGVFTRADARAALEASASSGLASFFLRAIADADGNGELTDAEREAFLAPLSATGPLAPEVLSDWIAAVEMLPPPPENDRGRRVPPVVLASMRPLLDADNNGELTVTDLNGLHRGADQNGDGVVSAAELANRQAPAFARWEVDPELATQPPAMPWQRTLEDALLLVERTQKPLLICVNMDGENASEVLAWNLYRNTEFAALADGFVCVLASPDKREPLERDDRGRRLPDRRFGRLVNSDHIDIEPKLFERYFRGTRVAPRHVGVAPNGEILFDLYLLQDLSIIVEKLREHGRADAPAAAPASLSIEELLASPDAGHRDELEGRFLESDEPARVQLVSRALAVNRPVQHPEIVRMAMRDESEQVRRAAAMLLANAPSTYPLDLVPAAFREASDMQEALLAGLRSEIAFAEQAGETQRAKDVAFYVRLLPALEAPSRHLNLARWTALLEGSTGIPRPTPTAEEFEPTIAQLERVDAALAVDREDAALLLRRAELLAHLARTRMATGENPLYFLQDVERAAEDCIVRAPWDGRALGLKAWALFQLNKLPESGEAALLALPNLAREAASPLAFDVLEVLTTAKTREIYEAISAGLAWGEGAVQDALTGSAVLCAHPLADESHWIQRLQLLGTLRAYAAQREVVREGLRKLPVSETLHYWLRFLELRDGGSRALEAAYDGEPFASLGPEYGSTITWYHGLATLNAAEHDVQCRDTASARAAYARAGERFQSSADAEPGFAGSVAYYSAQILSGLARLQLADGRIDDAAQSIITALETAPGSADQPDGLGQSPLDTARAVVAALEEANNTGQVEAVRAAATSAGVEL